MAWAVKEAGTAVWVTDRPCSQNELKESPVYMSQKMFIFHPLKFHTLQTNIYHS